MPPVRMRGDGRKAKNPGKTLLRIFGFMKHYIPNLILVLLCIVITAVASTRGSENLGTLVDDYILPMVAAGSTDFGPLLRYLGKIAAIFGCGMVAAFLQQFLMVAVTQGTQNAVEEEACIADQHSRASIYTV